MEGLIPPPSHIINFSDDELHKTCFSSFEQMRRKGKLCDVTLISETRRFAAHKIVLAATIPFFNGMFLSNMSEANKNEISILGLDSCALDAFIGFAYSGSIQITPYNVQSLLIGASFLQLNSIREICCKYIEERLSPSTVLAVRSFAQSFMCMNLAAACENYICDHFDAVSQNESFLSIEGDDLLALLDSDELCVSTEENLFQLIINWVEYEDRVEKHGDIGENPTTVGFKPDVESAANRSIHSAVAPIKSEADHPLGHSAWSFCRPLSCSDPCLTYTQTGYPTELNKTGPSRLALLPELLKRVRLPLIPAAYISTVISKHRLIRENIHCRDLLDEVRDMLLLRDRAASSFSCRPRRGQEVYGIIYAVGGLTNNGDCHGIVETYHPSLGRWELAEHMPSQRSRIGVVGLNGRLYAIGGFDGTSRLNTTEVYDPKTKSWETVAPMNHKRSALGAAALDGRIYVCGGYDGIASLKSCEVYNPIQNKWHLIPSMMEPRSAGGLVALSNGCLYAVGGHNGLAIYSSVECCNRREGGLRMGQMQSSSGTRPVSTNAWYPVARMIYKRCRHGVTALRNRIIVAGGYNGITFLRSVEIFDPAAGPDQNGLMGQWTEVASLEVPRSRVGLAVTGGRLYAIGGYDGFAHLRTVECFQPPTSYTDPPVARTSYSSTDAESEHEGRLPIEAIMRDGRASRSPRRQAPSATTSQSNVHPDASARSVSSDEETSSLSTHSTNTATSPEPTISYLEAMTRGRASTTRTFASGRSEQGVFANWRWTPAAPLIAHEGWVGVGVLPLCGETHAAATPVNKACVSIVPGRLHSPVTPSSTGPIGMSSTQSSAVTCETVSPRRGQTT